VPLGTLLRRGKRPAKNGGVWAADDVLGGVDPAVHTVRTYVEHADLRKALERARKEVGIEDAGDIGAGYGRMSLVLGEYARHVVPFERESSLVETGRRLLPDADWRQVESLDRLPADDGCLDLVLTFTVIQHMTNEFAEKVLAEARRVVRKPGVVLLCEESDPEHRWGPVGDTTSIFTIGRSVEQYQELMKPFELADAFPRRMEPGYPREVVGHYMLFKAT
jgi:SAM-dependent methyltransferase